MTPRTGKLGEIGGVALAVPGDLSTISGGYEYARQILALTQLTHLPLPGGFPAPCPDCLSETADRLARWDGPLLIDGLAYGAFSKDLAQSVGPRSVVLLHHPLDRECDASEAEATARFYNEKAALAFARGVIATSKATAEDLAARFGVSAQRCRVAEPGVERAQRSFVHLKAGLDPVQLLCVGAVIPRKGHDLLIEALALSPADLDYRLDIVGPLGRAPDYEAALRARIADAGLVDKIVFRGSVSSRELHAAYAEADIAVLPSRYEGFGMAATEAIVRGLPLIAGRGGALEQTAAAGSVVDVEDAQRFASVLRSLIVDRSARAAAAERCWAAAQQLPRWEETAQGVETALLEFF